MTLRRTQLTPEAQAKLVFQKYTSSIGIEGVIRKDLTHFNDDGGLFLELGRFNAGLHELFPDFALRQVSYSQILPGAIKAFHLHLKQDDVWFVPPHERLLVVLVDQRVESKSCGQMMRFVMGGGKSQLLFIPRGVAHGSGNLWTHSVSVIYFMNQQFDPKNPDEGRLPWDLIGADVWSLTKG